MFKLKSAYVQIGMKVLLWVLLAVLAFHDITSMLNNTDKETRNMVSQFMKNSEKKDYIETGAKTFATQFAKEYFTYDADNEDDYQSRIKMYAAPSVEPDKLQKGMKAEAIDTGVLGLSWVGSNINDRVHVFNVDVNVRVRYLQDSSWQDDTVYMRIPIAETGWQYVVHDYPLILPQLDKAVIATNAAGGNSASDEVTKAVSETLISFFKAYYSGSRNDIKYFMVDGASVDGINNRFTFTALNDVKVYEIKGQTGSYRTIATIKVADSKNGKVTTQRISMNVEKKQQRYYINSFDTNILKTFGR